MSTTPDAPKPCEANSITITNDDKDYESPLVIVIVTARVIAKNHFRMMQAEAVLSGWSMKLLRAVQSRSVSSSGVRAR